MAGLGFKDFQVGEVLTSSDVDGYLMQQTVMRFPDAAARGSALGTAPGTAVALAEGMVSYLVDTDTVEVYDGSLWVGVGPAGIGPNVVQAAKTDVFTTTSTSYTDITDLTVTITPTANTSKVLVIAHAIVSNANQNDSVFIQLVRDSTAIFIGDAAGNRVRASSGLYLGNVSLASGSSYSAPISYIDSPATTSATTYKLQMRSALGNAAILGRQDNDTDNAQRGRFPASLIAVEVKA